MGLLSRQIQSRIVGSFSPGHTENRSFPRNSNREILNTIWCGSTFRVIACVMVILVVNKLGLPQGVVLFDDAIDVWRMLHRCNVSWAFLPDLVVSLQFFIVVLLPDLVVHL